MFTRHFRGRKNSERAHYYPEYDKQEATLVGVDLWAYPFNRGPPATGVTDSDSNVNTDFIPSQIRGEWHEPISSCNLLVPFERVANFDQRLKCWPLLCSKKAWSQERQEGLGVRDIRGEWELGVGRKVFCMYENLKMKKKKNRKFMNDFFFFSLNNSFLRFFEMITGDSKIAST